MRQLDTETRQRVQRVLDRAKAEGRDPVQMLYDYGMLVTPPLAAHWQAEAVHKVCKALVERNWRAGNPTPDQLAATVLRVVREVEDSYRRGV